MLLGPLLATLLASGVPPVSAADSATAPSCRALAAAMAPEPLVPDLAAALAAHGGAVRWVTEGRPLVVWLQPRPRGVAPTLNTAFEWQAALAEGALGWSDAVPGLRLAIGHDSARADVRVVWARTLPAAQPGDPTAGALTSLPPAPSVDAASTLAAFTAGRTTLEPAPDGRAVAATVVLAARSADGIPYQPRDARAVVRHELGHALGLGHHASPASVMAPVVRAERIGEADRAVLRALYTLPAGAPCRAGS
jgi:hypothetical protein